MTALSERLTEAVDYARIAHASQVRKRTTIPYLSHLLGVASIVLEHGGDEDLAIAGLLHDVIEDCGESHRSIIRDRFGDAVARIVEDCTDGSAESKASQVEPADKRQDWRVRKLAYLAHLRGAPDATLLVSGCDKLHNARAIVCDLENPRVGTVVFDRFNAGRDDTLRYYQSLAEVFSARGTLIAAELDSTVERMHALAGVSTRTVLIDEAQTVA